MEDLEKIRLPWSDWKIVKYLGGGTYGKVYEIERNISGVQEKAALKIVSRPKDDSEIETYYDEGYDKASIVASYDREIQNYVQEYTLMKKLQGQTNIVSCDDFTVVPHVNRIGGDIFIRMELLTSLQQVLRQKTLSVQEIIKLGKDISNALILCEIKNIVHRDIKPANIMVSEFGDYKLGDFGVSKMMNHTTYATVMGTPEYEAPEVRHGERYGRAADIYSLGITLYWLLNDRKMPFIDAKKQLTPELRINAMERRYRGEKLPAPKNGSEELKKIVLKACEYRQEDRYASAQELYDALDEIGSEKSHTPNTWKNNHIASFSDNGWGEKDETIEKNVHGIRQEETARMEALIALQRILKERMIFMQENDGAVEETRGGLNGGQTAGNSWGGGKTIGKERGNTKKEKSSEDDWMASGETVGKTMGGFSGGQTIGNSWWETGETIGKPKENTKKEQKEVQEEPVTETIDVKKAYQKQEKKAEEKKEVTAENKTKKVKITKVGYIWSFLVIGFFVFVTYEFWIKEGFAVLVYESFVSIGGFPYNICSIFTIVMVFFYVVYPQLAFLHDVEKNCLKTNKQKADGDAAVLMGGRLALVFLNISDLNMIKIILILVFLFICWKVGTEWINDRCYEFE